MDPTYLVDPGRHVEEGSLAALDHRCAAAAVLALAAREPGRRAPDGDGERRARDAHRDVRRLILRAARVPASDTTPSTHTYHRTDRRIKINIMVR